MKTVSLSQLLTDDMAGECAKIIATGEDDFQRVKELKEYLVKFRAELEAKGILPEYLAYVLLANCQPVLKKDGELTPEEKAGIQHYMASLN